MIQSKQDLKDYLLADETARGINEESFIRKYLFLYEAKYQRYLRLAEYYYNKNNKLKFLVYLYYKYKLKKLGLMLGFSVPINTCGQGLCLVHAGTVVISQHAKIGTNCRIHVDVNIGASGSVDGAPIIGNNVYIGPGAKLFGKITIASDIAIGANAVVNKSFKDQGITIGKIPAVKIGDNGSKGIFQLLEEERNV